MKQRFPAWQLAIFMLISLSLACSLGLPGGTPVIPPTPTATPLPLPPTIVETVPPVGSEIPRQAPLTLYFSENMQRDSVESALQADFPGGFVFSWINDATLTLAPRTALPPASRITITLDSSARSAGGLTPLLPIDLTYQTPGPLRVTQILPAAMASQVSPDSAVVVSFNQPVTALGADPASLPAGLTLEPPASGKGEWLNTSTYIFHADPALAGGVQYVARVNPQLVSTSGMGLDPNSQNSTWTFSTSLPAVEKVTAAQTNDFLDLEGTIEIAFNQPMDTNSVENALTFSGPSGRVNGSLTWNKKGSVLTFKPLAQLERATNYNLVIGAGAHSRGGAALGSQVQYSYQSVPAFGFYTATFSNGTTRPRNKDIAVIFSSPLADYSESELEALITISPRPGYHSFYVEGARVNISGGFEPGKSYTVTFSSRLKDRWGGALGQDFNYQFNEQDAAPELSMGVYLSTYFARPDDPVISIQAVNVDTINVSRGAMTTDEFIQTQINYQYRENYAPAEVQTWQVKPGLPLNDNRPVDLSMSDGPLAPGFYFIQISSPQASNQAANRQVLVSSNINATLKTSPTQALVWAVDLRTNAPAQNLPVKLYDEKAVLLASGQTDQQGLWQTDLPARPEGQSVMAILGQPGDDQFGAASTDWSAGISSWNFNLPSTSAGPHTETYLYTERPVYRPGDTVHYRGILKNLYDGRYTDAQTGELGIEWVGPNGKLGSRETVKVSGYGSFSGEYKLPANAAPGYYNLSVYRGEEQPFNNTISFQVADYRKPEVNLSVSLSPDPARNGQTITGSIKAEYFFGAPVGDLPFTWRLYSQKSYFSIPDFNTGIETQRWMSTTTGRFGGTYRNGEGRTGTDGTFSIPFDNLQVDDASELTLEVTASESGGFPVSGRASISMHPEIFYIGVRPGAWVGQAGTPLQFSLVTVDWDKNPVSQPLTVAFEKVRFERSDDPGGASFTPIFTPLESKTVTTAFDGAASLSFTPADAGTYVLDVTSGAAHTQTLIWVSGGQNAEWPNLPYQQVQITADKDKYKPGETAEVFIPNPFNAPALALLTSERSTFKSVDVVSVPAEGYRLRLPLTDNSAPNIYVSATLIGPQGVDFRQGYIDLPVDPSAFVLNVDLKATPEKAQPGDTVSLDLTVTDSGGQPVQGEFSIAVVDLAALALADPNSQDIVPAYYDIQPLGVRTGLTAAIYSRRVLNMPGGMGGGGGGDILTLREKFPDTAFWKADILTDAQGKARISLILPDNLTTWQVDTRGLTGDTRVGQARVRVLTSKDLIVRPQTPRFLVAGDHAELAAIVNNTTNQPVDAAVGLQVTGLTLDAQPAAVQSISIPANGRIRVTWSGLVQDGDAVDAIFTVKAGDLLDAARPDDGPIPVLRYAAPQTFSTAGVLTGKQTRQEIIAVPRSFQPLGGNLQVELSPSLAAAILGSLKALESASQPWDMEQVMSTLLPNIVTYRALKDSGIEDADLSARLQTNLSTDLKRLLAFQQPDGGWPWTADSQHTDPYLTAYVLFGLQQVSDSALNVEGADLVGAIQRGRDFLSTNADAFTGKADLSEGWQADRAAFFCYVLQSTGGLTPVTDLTERLYQNRSLLAPWSRAMLAQTLYSLSQSDERVRTLVSDLEAGAIRSATGAHWESASAGWINPGSPLFTSAIVLNTLAERDPASPLAADAVRYLASQRSSGGLWSSSYETAWVILALDRFMLASGELRGDFSFSATLNGSPLAQGQASGPQNMTTITSNAPLTGLNLAGSNLLLVDKQDGTGNLYYRAALSVDRPVESAPALERGLSITRQYLDCAADPCQPVNGYTIKPDGSGHITVRLALSLPTDMYHLMVQDLIPAGADILDASLATSQQGQEDQGALPQFDPADPFGAGWGWWYFNNPRIYADHLLWSADYLPAGSYILTYTLIPSLAGQYHVLPARAWQAYFPEVQGSTSGTVFEIRP